MLAIPALDQPSVVFGDIKHMPKYETIPEEFKRGRNAYVDAVSHWFFAGAKKTANGIMIDGKEFTPKAGVDMAKALRAIQAVLGSFSPAHEVKEAACGYMLSEWFDIKK